MYQLQMTTKKLDNLFIRRPSRSLGSVRRPWGDSAKKAEGAEKVGDSLSIASVVTKVLIGRRRRKTHSPNIERAADGRSDWGKTMGHLMSSQIGIGKKYSSM